MSFAPFVHPCVDSGPIPKSDEATGQEELKGGGVGPGGASDHVDRLPHAPHKYADSDAAARLDYHSVTRNKTSGHGTRCLYERIFILSCEYGDCTAAYHLG